MLQNVVDRVTMVATKLFSSGVAMPTAAKRALDECDINENDRPFVESEVCSRLGTRGAKEKARLGRIKKQPSFFRPRTPIQPNRPPSAIIEPDEQYLLDERHAIQNESR